MTKKFTMLEVTAIINFYEDLINNKKEIADALPLKVKWTLKRAIQTMFSDAKSFNELRDAELAKITEKYFNEDHSIVTKIEGDADAGYINTEGGNIGNTKYEIKEEFKDEYTKEFLDFNARLSEILTEQNEYEYNGLNLDDYIDAIDDKVVPFEVLDTIDSILK